MSESTPTHILQAVYNNARGIGRGPVVTRKQGQAIILDLGGWFMFWGLMIDMRMVSIGGGLYLLQGEIRG